MMARSATTWCILASAALLISPSARCARADDHYAENAARLEKMTADQKDELRRKKMRFDGLNSDEQQKLRDLHAAIASDSNSKELQETV
jgi:hypothetical protein